MARAIISCNENEKEVGEEAEKRTEDQISTQDYADRLVQEANIARAKSDCIDIEQAVRNFQLDYSFLPFGGTGNSPEEDMIVKSDNALISVLTGNEDAVNKRMIKYLNPRDAVGDKDSGYRNGIHSEGGKSTIYDPWGNMYQIVIDYDYDNKIAHPFAKGEVIRNEVFVYSLGPDGKGGSPETDKDNVSRR